MEVGVVKIAEDSDFDMLKSLVDDDTNWKLEYDKGESTKVSKFGFKMCFSCLFTIHLTR